jgi:hypothetical protein
MNKKSLQRFVDELPPEKAIKEIARVVKKLFSPIRREVPCKLCDEFDWRYRR